MAAVVYHAAGLVVGVNNTIDLPMAHLFNGEFGVAGTANPAAGTRDYPAQFLQMLAFALGRRNPNNPGELDALFYGVNGINVIAIFANIEHAKNAGFMHGVMASGSTVDDGFSIVRSALVWAQNNWTLLRSIVAGDFHALPPLAGGGNPPRMRMAYSLFAQPVTFLLAGLVEIIGLSGYVHDANSRGGNSKLARLFDTVVDHLNTPPIANQPFSVSNALVNSGLPLELVLYPSTLVEEHVYLRLRLHYMQGTFAERRQAFQTYVPLLLAQSNTLQSFLQPAINLNQCVDAYITMARNIYTSVQPPADATLFSKETAFTLAGLLAHLPEIPQQANAQVPIGDAAHRAQQANLEFDRRRQVIANAATGGPAVTDASSGTVNVQATKALKQQVISELLPLPFVGPALADIVRLHAANLTNDFPCIKRGLQTHNVLFYQILIGRVRGVGDSSAGLRVLESVSGSILKYVDHATVMDKAPSLTPGLRQPHTLKFVNEEFTKEFLSHNRSKFQGLNILTVANKIRCAREQTPLQSVSAGAHLFASAENIPILRYFSHYLDPFEFASTGPGSWDEAMTRLERFRSAGLSMPGQSLTNHFTNCYEAYQILINELFDALGHFTQPREASDVKLSLSPRVFETGGAFDQHLQFQNTNTSSLNALLLLNPSFGLAMGGNSVASSSAPPPDGTTSVMAPPKGNGGKAVAGASKHNWSSGGVLRFGKGTVGPTYATPLIWAEVKKLKSNANSGNFCMLQYLSNQNNCTNQSHAKGGQHNFTKELLALRPDFEHQPFRTDAKAKPSK